MAGGWVPIENRLQFGDKIASVLELMVDAVEPDVSDLVDLRQPFHHQITDLPRRDLEFVFLGHLLFDFGHQFPDLFGADGTLPAGSLQSLLQLVAVEWLTNAILLDNQQ